MQVVHVLALSPVLKVPSKHKVHVVSAVDPIGHEPPSSDPAGQVVLQTEHVFVFVPLLKVPAPQVVHTGLSSILHVDGLINVPGPQVVIQQAIKHCSVSLLPAGCTVPQFPSHVRERLAVPVLHVVEQAEYALHALHAFAVQHKGGGFPQPPQVLAVLEPPQSPAQSLLTPGQHPLAARAVTPHPQPEFTNPLPQIPSQPRVSAPSQRPHGPERVSAPSQRLHGPEGPGFPHPQPALPATPHPQPALTLPLSHTPSQPRVSAPLQFEHIPKGTIPPQPQP